MPDRPSLYLLACLAAVMLCRQHAAAADIPAELVPGVTGHPTYMTHSYSQPLLVPNGDVFLVFLEDDARTSSSVIRRDRRSGAWSHPFRLGGGRRYDAHYYPNMVIDGSGILHVFYGCHGDAMKYRRSRRMLDVSDWEPESLPLAVATYPRPFVLASGELIVFTRTQRNRDIRYGYITSNDGGRSWSAFNTVIHGPGRLWCPYVGGITIVEGGEHPTVHIAWSWYDMVRMPKPFYYADAMYASFELGAAEWKSADGSKSQLPISHETARPILRREKAYVEDSAVDSLGRPLVLISQYGLTDQEQKESRTLLAVLENDVWRLDEPLPGVVLPVGGARMVCAAGWTAIVGFTAQRGLIIAQRRDGAEEFIVRPVQLRPDVAPVHPVIVADEEQSRFHVVATAYRSGQPGRLIYASAPIEP